MIYLFILLLIIITRFVLLKEASKNVVDQYYWLLYRKAVKIQKKLPPSLPEYILEIKQWYPPLFGWFLSLIPDSLFKYSHLITQLLSLFRLFLLFIVIYFFDLEYSFSLFLSVVIYLIAPILVYYDNQINSRVFGAIIVDILIILFFVYFEYALFYLLIPILLLTTTLLFMHKMSHQLYLFLLLGLSIYYLSLTPIIIYVLSNALAIVFFNYKNYLKHHIEIVKFWHRNSYKLGAHQFYESDIYGKNNFVYRNRLHGNGIKSFIKKLSLIVGMLPFSIFILFNFEFNFFGLIIFITLLFIFLTSFVDYFLCLGSGNLYTYNLVLFEGLYIIFTDINYFSLFNQILLLIVFLMTFFSIYKFYIGLKVKSKDEDYDNAMEYIKQSTIDRIVAIPLTPSDEIAYRTEKKVFWGGHGLGFKYLEPYFPVFNKKIEEAVNEWNIGGVFLQKDYWPEFFEKVNKNIYEIVYENSKYIILKIKNFENLDKKPLWAKEIYRDIV
ncbi:MAG: hypothetical protein L3J10_03680 [Sulfurimonas sp.]|nr:hypothetical protein [Sulfurimonas sp.]